MQYYCRISDLINGLHEDGIEPNILLNNLEYVQEALKYFISEHKYLSSSLRQFIDCHIYTFLRSRRESVLE